MKTAIASVHLFLLALSLAAQRSPNRMEIFYTPEKFAAYNDDLALLMPSLSEITFDTFAEDTGENTKGLVVDYLDIIWAHYNNDLPEVTVETETRTMIQHSGKITVSFDISFLCDSSHHYCLDILRAEIGSQKITLNRTFHSDSERHQVDVALYIEWEDIRLLNIGKNDIYLEELTKAINQSLKQKLSNAISQKLLHELKIRYNSQSAKGESSIYFVPHSSLMIELQKKLEIYDFDQQELLFGHEYSLTDEQKSTGNKGFWQPNFDRSISGYQVAIGKPLVERLVRHALDFDYFTYFFNIDKFNANSNQKSIGFNGLLAFGIGDDLEDSRDKRFSLMCQLNTQQSPEITFSEQENLIKIPQNLICGFLPTPSAKSGSKKMLKFLTEVVVSYQIGFNQAKHETTVKIADIEVSDTVEIMNPHSLLSISAEAIREWVVEGVQTLKGKMAQLGSGFDIPIQEAHVYVKKDHLLFVGEPLKRLMNLYPTESFNAIV